MKIQTWKVLYTNLIKNVKNTNWVIFIKCGTHVDGVSFPWYIHNFYIFGQIEYNTNEIYICSSFGYIE